MIRTVIGEDDASFAKLLARLLKGTGKVEIVGTATAGDKCLDVVRETTPDLLLLDIDMPVLTGIEVAELALASNDPPLIVFLTGHDDYAVKAFRLQATDYVLKPVDSSELASQLRPMLERVETELKHRALAVQGLRERLDAASAPIRGRLPVKDYAAGTLRIVPTRDISHIVRRDRHVVVHVGKEALPTNYTVQRLAQRLDPEGIVQVSPSALVNLEYVRFMIPNGDGTYDVFLSDPDETVVETSRGGAKTLLARLKD